MNRRNTLLCTLFTSLPLLANTGMAGITSIGDTVSRNISLDEVEVVATVKEHTAMRHQPSAVSLMSRQQLDDSHVTSLKGLSAQVPNFFMPDYGSRLTSAVYIRGIGSRINTPAVGMYVDNIPYTDKTAFDFNFYDIERVDVMRGPQGTLYGRNAMGGIIRVYTMNPFTYSGTKVRMGYTTGDNCRTISLTHYHRISDAFAFSGGGYYEGSTGFFCNSLTGRKVDGIQAGGGRVRGIYKPTNRLTLDMNASYDYTDEGAYPYFRAANGYDSDELYHGAISNNRDNTYRRGMFNAGVNMEYIAPKYVLDAITGFQNLSDRMFMDQDFIYKDIYTIEQKQRINTISEELTLKSRGKKRWEWVTGASFMYQWLHTEGPVTFYADGLDWLAGNINSHMPDIPTRIPSMAKMGFKEMKVNLRGDNLMMGGRFDTPSLNAALFHHSTVHLTERLSAILGLRMEYENTTMRYDAPATVDYGFQMVNPSPMLNVNLQDLTTDLAYRGTIKDDYWNLLPKFAMKYDVPEDGNVYASIAMGKRSGGYNVQMFSDLLQGSMQNAMMKGIATGVEGYLQKFIAMGMPAAMVDKVVNTMKENIPVGVDPSVDQVTYKPEYSWNFEVGSHLNFLDRKVQLDAAAFLITTHNQQIARFAQSGLGRMMLNAGTSRSMGAELTTLWKPDAHWVLSANYGYTHATFTDYDAGNGKDYTGNCVPFVPRHTVNIDAAYTWLMPEASWLRSITFGADYRGTGSLYWNESNTDRQGYYSLLGARMAMKTKKATLQLWTKNITGKHYNTFAFESAGRQFEQHGKPFQFGIDIEVKM